MKCRTCDGKGLMLQKTFHMEHIGVDVRMSGVHLETVVCNCCGGYADDCLTCRTGVEINWVDEVNYAQALDSYTDEISAFFQEHTEVEWLRTPSMEAGEVEYMMRELKKLLRPGRRDPQELIPGNPKKDIVVLARQSRLTMMQLLYDKGRITEEEARNHLNGNLSIEDDTTYYNDSALLQTKEIDDGRNSEETSS